MPPRFVPLLVGLLGLMGCGSSMQVSSTGPELSEAAAPREGLRYYLGRDLLVVDANVTIRTERQWKKKERDKPCQPEDDATSSWRHTTLDVSSTTVADRRAQYRLGLKPSSTVLQTLNVTVSDAGLLTGVNYTSKDQTGEIVTNLVKGVAGVAGALVGIPSALGGAKYIQPPKGEPVVKPPTNEECYAADADGIKLRDEAQRLRDTLKKALDTRRKRLAEADRATSQAALGLVRTRDSLLAIREQLQAQRVDAARVSLSAGPGALAKKHDVGFSDTTVKVHAVMDLSEVPDSLPGLTFGKAIDQLTKAKLNAAFLLDTTRILVVVRELSQLPKEEKERIALYQQLGGEGDKVPSPSKAPFACSAPPDADCSRIFFRQPIPRLLQIYVARNGEPDAPMDLREERIVLLASSEDPALNVGFKAKKLAESGTKLAFGKYGNLTGLEQTSSASLASATSAFTAALTGARQEFTASLKSVQEAQGASIAIRQALVGARLKALQDQKSLVDAQVALEGAAATKELVSQKLRVDADLNLLTAQQSLLAVQENATSSAQINDLQGQLQELQLQVQILQQQVALQNAKRDLDKAQ